MYVTTFYSFKGGVGRSMALANAAVELAKRGRRVLVVDFDLEAPGLDTFDVLHPRKAVPGIIDFVREYINSDRAPDVKRFMARLPDVGDQGGKLWIMPSGAQKVTYAAHFNEIDWAELYDKRDGYLLFEDLKAQWEQAVNPDYVLIDSRTGHTDTGGICTRQLPDAVAILFFPNEQNLRGLTKVVKDIRAEAGEPRRKAIELHFVMSNVPDLDDEDRILEKKIQGFRKGLTLERDPLTVHRYDSLSLLNQAVFTKDRPKSRLATEYRAVVDQIVGRNFDDRNGALSYLERTSRLWRHRSAAYESQSNLEKNLRRIEKAHAEDGEVLFELGRFRENHPRVARVSSLFDRAIEAGYDEPDVYMQRAEVRKRDGDPDGASDDALHVLESGAIPLAWQAVELIRPNESEAAAAALAVVALDVGERFELAGGLERPDQIKVSTCILESIVDDPDVPDDEARTEVRGVLAMRLVATGACIEAAKLLRHEDRSIEDMNINDAFNYGMATWGATGTVDREPFDRVVKLDESESESPDSPNPRYLQGLALAKWAIGDLETASQFEARAREAVRGSAFSCWRYTKVPANQFMEDLDDIKALIGGDTSRVPRFMRNEPASGATG